MSNVDSKSDEEKDDKNDSKSDLSSLVFTFDCVFKGLLKSEIKKLEISLLKDKSAEYVLKNKNLSPNKEDIPLYVYRTNPANSFFIIDKSREKYNDIPQFNVHFSSLKAFIAFKIHGDIYSSFLSLCLSYADDGNIFCLILGFKDDETIQRLIRNLLFCNDELNFSVDPIPPSITIDTSDFIYSAINVTIKAEIYEIETNGDHCSVPRDSKGFKLRRNVPKLLQLLITPATPLDFLVDRCFGFLYSSKGFQNVEKSIFSDFTFDNLIDFEDDRKISYRLRAAIFPGSDESSLFNCKEDDAYVNLFCSADLVVKGIVSPVRFNVPLKAKMFSENEKFWIKGAHKVRYNYIVCLKRDNVESSSPDMSLVSIVQQPKLPYISKSLEELAQLQKCSNGDIKSPSIIPQSDHQDFDAILSGTFSFEPEMPSEILEEWNSVIATWRESKETPLNLQRLLKYGIPSHLRKHVWPLIVGLSNGTIISQTEYSDLVLMDSQYEKVIKRDTNRTFTCHEFFKKTDGEGQQQLYNVCKAYSNYDKDVGYCQGLSFIVANFLLHFDEIHSFSLLVQVMYKIGHRAMFGQSFEELQCFMYVFKRLIYMNLPELAKHFNDIGLEPQMFGPQWFLTLFTSKFPLGMVDQALDMYLSQGERSLLQISIAMLTICCNDILNLNFENTLKYLCNKIPNKFCSSSSSKELFQLAFEINFPPSSFEELRIEFDAYKKHLSMTLDPYELKKIENRMLIDCQMRLEQENNLLAYDLVQTKVQCNEQLTNLRDDNSKLMKSVSTLNTEILQLNLTVSMLQDQEKILKQELRKIVDEHSDKISIKEAIINDYKKVCVTFESKEAQLKKFVEENTQNFQSVVQNCEKCKEKFDELEISTCYLTPSRKSSLKKSSDKINVEIIEKLEMDLALAKMKVADVECKNEELEKLILDCEKKNNRKWFKK